MNKYLDLLITLFLYLFLILGIIKVFTHSSTEAVAFFILSGVFLLIKRNDRHKESE